MSEIQFEYKVLWNQKKSYAEDITSDVKSLEETTPLPLEEEDSPPPSHPLRSCGQIADSEEMFTEDCSTPQAFQKITFATAEEIHAMQSNDNRDTVSPTNSFFVTWVINCEGYEGDSSACASPPVQRVPAIEYGGYQPTRLMFDGCFDPATDTMEGNCYHKFGTGEQTYNQRTTTMTVGPDFTDPIIPTTGKPIIVVTTQDSPVITITPLPRQIPLPPAEPSGNVPTLPPTKPKEPCYPCVPNRPPKCIPSNCRPRGGRRGFVGRLMAALAAANGFPPPNGCGGECSGARPATRRGCTGCAPPEHKGRGGVYGTNGSVMNPLELAKNEASGASPSTSVSRASVRLKKPEAYLTSDPAFVAHWVTVGGSPPFRRVVVTGSENDLPRTLYGPWQECPNHGNCFETPESYIPLARFDYELDGTQEP